MSTDPNHITRAQLADLIGARSSSYINELEKTGRAIRAPDGKHWLKAESLAASPRQTKAPTAPRLSPARPKAAQAQTKSAAATNKPAPSKKSFSP